MSVQVKEQICINISRRTVCEQSLTVCLDDSAELKVIDGAYLKRSVANRVSTECELRLVTWR